MRRALWLLVAASALAASDAPTVTVMVRETQLRKAPQFYSPAVAAVKLGQRLTSIDGEGAWFKVVAQGKTGWIHQSAVTTRRVTLSDSGPTGSEASADEVTLAGKGFNESVEGTYRRKHPRSNFAAVESLVRSSVPERDVLRFVREGGLGGAP